MLSGGNKRDRKDRVKLCDGFPGDSSHGELNGIPFRDCLLDYRKLNPGDCEVRAKAGGHWCCGGSTESVT